ncbi:N-acetylmuramoyl-L-alanine amidase [Tropicibacter naphthalenivorans]|uniref:N-acetylmuramoyl-L-alanine amidase n=2 Tax=Tropicibacter naphthalenivorans TaxID=441103 RepID=A0A0P1GPN9_9RHOB|nr:N-acetylmuramoyl-L-alanine amidase AmiC precursor [Tropicibacter naphthalenivorans]SMC54971.1 N-acetylmuramoyl-L-alanine amidase [Tropicibacter naphthalenivorans]
MAALVLCAAQAGAQEASGQETSGLARFEAGQISDAMFGGTTLELALSQGVPWRAFTLTDPMRLVLDFREVDWQGADAQVLDQSEAVTALRMGAFRPGWSRLVAELSEPLRIEQAGLSVSEDTGQAGLTVVLKGTSAAAFEASAGMPRDPTWDRPAPSAHAPKAAASGRPVIVLDPGHGGIDPGAERDGFSEADLVLRFALEFREVLLRTGQYDVVMTRESDQFVSLEGRVSFAHEVGADLFISLHADALDEGRAHGASVYTLAEEASDAASAALAERHDRDDLLAGLDLSGADDRVAQVLMDLARLDNTPRSQALAGHLVGGIKNALGQVHKRPLRQAGFSVLKAADIPSVLVELGFLSTEQDLANLRDPIWRAGMAAGLRDGIAAWAVEDAALARLRRQ